MILLLILAIFSLCYYKIYKHYHHWQDRGVKQCKPTYIFGDYTQIILRKETFIENMLRLWNSFPDDRYFGIYQTLIPTLILKDPELIKQITIKSFDHFANHRPFIPDGIDPLWNQNLVSLKGNDWREMRATLSPSFTSSKMKIIFTVMSEFASTYLDHFLKDGKTHTLEMKDILTKYTTDVTAAVSFGVKCDSIRDSTNEFYRMGRKISESFFTNMNFIAYIFPNVCKVLKIKLFPEDVSNFIITLVQNIMKFRQQNVVTRPDMMHLLLETRNKEGNTESNTIDTGFATAIESGQNNSYQRKKQHLSDIDIAAQAMIFFGAGFESVAALMSFMAYELATNLNVQQKLQKEIDETREECNGKLTYEALMKMKYLDMVVCETLRKYPSGVAIDRVCTKPYTIEPLHINEKPIQLNIGDVVMVPIGAVHYDPKYFPDPYAFDPERFSDENKDNIKPYTYIPFGLGPRNCIGSRFALLEAKTVFFHLLSKFDLLPTEKTEIPLQMNKKYFNMMPQNGIWVDFKPRNQTIVL